LVDGPTVFDGEAGAAAFRFEVFLLEGSLAEGGEQVLELLALAGVLV
jgi:hypothetical protein